MAVPVDEDAGIVSLKIFPQQIHGNSVSVGGFFYAQNYRVGGKQHGRITENRWKENTYRNRITG